MLKNKLKQNRNPSKDPDPAGQLDRDQVQTVNMIQIHS